MFRKITVCILSAILLLSLVGCPEIPKEFKLFEKKANIVQIDRVIVSYPDQQKQPSIEIVQEAAPEQINIIVSLLRKIPCRDPSIKPTLRPEHECFRITYADESYQLLAHDCNIYYSNDHSFLDNDLCAFEFNSFIRTWDKGF